MLDTNPDFSGKLIALGSSALRDLILGGHQPLFGRFENVFVATPTSVNSILDLFDKVFWAFFLLITTQIRCLIVI